MNRMLRNDRVDAGVGCCKRRPWLLESSGDELERCPPRPGCSVTTVARRWLLRVKLRLKGVYGGIVGRKRLPERVDGSARSRRMRGDMLHEWGRGACRSCCSYWQVQLVTLSTLAYISIRVKLQNFLSRRAKNGWFVDCESKPWL
jgi:hypothetical protein